MEKIGFIHFVNCILVIENVRPAMLVQPTDYRESTGTDPITKSITTEIKNQFPELILSEDYDTYQGVIISKIDYNGRKDISLEEMGKLLGYPCYKDFNHINTEEVYYSIHINIKHTIVSELYANVCKDKTKIKIFKNIANKIKNIFNKKEYKEIFDGFDVEIKVNKIIPNKMIIDKLINNKTLTKNEKYSIENIIFNLGCSIELQLYFSDNIQYKNPIHRGIMMNILISDTNDRLSPFYPLQNYKKEKEVEMITREWEKGLYYVIEKTKL